MRHLVCDLDEAGSCIVCGARFETLSQEGRGGEWGSRKGAESRGPESTPATPYQPPPPGPVALRKPHRPRSVNGLLGSYQHRLRPGATLHYPSPRVHARVTRPLRRAVAAREARDEVLP